jgi:hypothetical protein
MSEDALNMKAQLMHVDNVAGRVLVGPKKLRSCYARIVSQKDGSGRIEKFDLVSGTWFEAHESITFSEVWSAPSVPLLQWADIDRKS